MSKQRQQYQREQASAAQDRPVQECGGCRFFKGDGDSGECRRYPPMAGAKKVTPNGPLMSFPVVSLTDWCGEFQKQT